MLAWYLKLSKDAQSVPSDFALNRQHVLETEEFLSLESLWCRLKQVV